MYNFLASDEIPQKKTVPLINNCYLRFQSYFFFPRTREYYIYYYKILSLNFIFDNQSAV